MTQVIQKTLRDSLLLAMAMFCSYIFMDILSPIKDLMQETRGWDSTAFGTMQGSEVFLNVFVFFLIFAGIILDKMGVRFTAVLSAAVMLIGACIKWYAVSEGFVGTGLETWFTENLLQLAGSLAEVSLLFIPNVGIKHSQYGNICFPVWEQKKEK